MNTQLHSKLTKKDMLFEFRESDIREKFVHAEGKGGQNVNKVATCVYLRHLPTGIEVKYSGQRSQSANRIKARKILIQKVNDRFLNIFKKAKHEVEKEKRRNRKKPAKVKQRILDNKRAHSIKKMNRARVKYPPND